MKHLYLLRHAKSSWDDAALPDHDRPLAPRGREATQLLAKHLRRERIAPELVLCSSARRAQETLAGVAEALGDGVSVQVEPELYGASQRDLLERLRAAPDTVESVMVIGHNPAVQMLALTLPGGDDDELARIQGKYPTGGLATLTFDGRWHELGPHAARLERFVRPKDLG